METNIKDLCPKDKIFQENILLDIIKEVCSEPNSNLSQNLVGKVKRIIADCDLSHHTSLHKLVISDESANTVLGIMQQTATELTFDEQAELNQAIINKIQDKIPIVAAELEDCEQNIGVGKNSHSEKMKELQESLDEKLNKLGEQEDEKVKLMMEWLTQRAFDVSAFSCRVNEQLTLKTTHLQQKAKVLHLRTLQRIFTETNQSVKAYSEIHKDIKDQLRETEERIKKYKDIIASLSPYLQQT